VAKATGVFIPIFPFGSLGTNNFVFKLPRREKGLKTMKTNRSMFVLISALTILVLALSACAPAATPAPAPITINVDQTTVVNVEQGAAAQLQQPAAPAEKAEVAQPEAPAATPANTSKEPIQDVDFVDVTMYSSVAKFSIGSDFYCVALRTGVKLPTEVNEYNHIEDWPKYQKDGNYLHSPIENMFSMAAFCGNDSPENHLAPLGTEWLAGKWEVDGFHPESFPLK
jgi:hypothetical protein